MAIVKKNFNCRNPLGGSFGFHLNRLLNNEDFVKVCRNPLGGSFGFHVILLGSHPNRMGFVAIPLAGLLVSTVRNLGEKYNFKMSQSPWRVFWFPQSIW